MLSKIANNETIKNSKTFETQEKSSESLEISKIKDNWGNTNSNWTRNWLEKIN